MASYVFTDVNLREAQLYADYVSIEHDLSRTRDFVAMVLQEQRNAQPNWSLLGALMVAVIVQYARPFSGDQRARTGEKRELILSPEQLEAHQYYLAIRSKFIAHSVNAFEDNQPVAYYVAEEPEQGVTSISCQHRRVAALAEADLETIDELAGAWLTYVRQRRETEQAALLEIVQQIPLEDLLKEPQSDGRLDLSRPMASRRRF